MPVGLRQQLGRWRLKERRTTNEPTKRTSPVSTPLATLSRPTPGHLAVPALLAAVAIGVAGCYNPADPAQVQPPTLGPQGFG
jgi:hypothetical protein